MSKITGLIEWINSNNIGVFMNRKKCQVNNYVLDIISSFLFSSFRKK
jgi:hypothetical protein